MAGVTRFYFLPNGKRVTSSRPGHSGHHEFFFELHCCSQKEQLQKQAKHLAMGRKKEALFVGRPLDWFTLLQHIMIARRTTLNIIDPFRKGLNPNEYDVSIYIYLYIYIYYLFFL